MPVFSLLTIVLLFQIYIVPVGTVGKKDWTYQPIADIDPDKLIRQFDLTGTMDELVDLVSSHMQDNLRDEKERGTSLPWWEFLMIENKDSDSPSALVFRVEHCIADGMSLAKLFEKFLTKEDGEPVDSLVPVGLSEKFKRERKQSRVKTYLKAIPAFGKVLSLAKSKFDHDTVFGKSSCAGMTYNSNRTIVLLPTAPLDFIKSIKNAHNVTVNDVLLTAVSIAITKYNKYHNCAVQDKKGEKLRCRALMPVALPRSQNEFHHQGEALRNKWVFVSANMGSGIEDYVERLKSTNKEMAKMKISPLVRRCCCAVGYSDSLFD